MTKAYSRPVTLVALFAVLAILAAASLACSAAQPLVDLDASKLSAGPLKEWGNAGTLKGKFTSDGTSPEVKNIDGVKAVDFSGDDRMLASFTAPASITADKPWTVIVKVYSRDISGERCLLSWANRPDNCLEIQHSDTVHWGALGTWSPNTTGWEGNLPAPKRWHTLIYSYQGGKDGEFQAWANGKLCVTKKFTLATKPDRPFVLGACSTADPGAAPGYVHYIDAAIASIKVYDRGFSPVECWNTYGKYSAYQTAPRPGAKLDTLKTTLKWAPGTKDATNYVVYYGTDKAAVEKLTDLKNVKGGKTVKPEFGPIDLTLGKTYYWRVDQLNASNKIINKGEVSSFSTETGNATDPNPADGYIVVEGGKYDLKWTPGKYAVKQNVYFGTTEAEVRASKKPIAAGVAKSVTSIPLPVAKPELGKTYYWRVESINSDGLPVSNGEVWSLRAVSKKLKVYLIGGQSNAVGCSSSKTVPQRLKGENRNVIIFIRGECRLGDYDWAYLKDGLGSSFGDRDGCGTIGPELTFGYNMAPRDPKQVIALLKCAWGGTNLGIQWRPPSAGGETGPLYKGFVEALHKGMDSLDPAFEPEIVGMIWMQGESDTGDPKLANEYEANLKALIRDIRAETKVPGMPFVHGTIAEVDAWKAYGDVVRAAQAKVAQTFPYTATFPTSDYGMCDPWHYDTAGMLSLGERFAEAMKKLEADIAGMGPMSDPNVDREYYERQKDK